MPPILIKNPPLLSQKSSQKVANFYGQSLLNKIGFSLYFRYFKRCKNRELVKEYILSITIGDWFVLYQMSKNLNRRFFYDFLIKLAHESCSETYKESPDKPIDQPDDVEAGQEETKPMLGLNKNGIFQTQSSKGSEAKMPSIDENEIMMPPLEQDSPRTLKKVHTA